MTGKQDNVTDLIRVGKAVVRRSFGGVRAFSRVVRGAEHSIASYSQYGEDMILRAMFARYPVSYRGFYVDVGAHHPLRFSNTQYFYEQQWNGVCVDPLPGTARMFARWRPRDVVLEIGVAETEGEMTYYMFDEPALNTFSEKTAKDNSGRLKGTRKVKTRALRGILADHLAPGCTIDFLSVDVEGMDLQVLRSNDWQQFRPCVVLFEEMSVQSMLEVADLESDVFMRRNGYVAVARLPSAVVYADECSPAYDGGVFLRFRGATVTECSAM